MDKVIETKSQMIMRIAELSEANEQLQAENERLKSALAIWVNATLKQTALKVVEVDKYRQALQEIRDICKMDCGDCEYNQDCDCNFSECEESKIDDILDKINEVIGAE